MLSELGEDQVVVALLSSGVVVKKVARIADCRRTNAEVEEQSAIVADVWTTRWRGH